MIYSGLYSTTYGSTQATYSGTGFRGDADGSDVYLDFSTGTGSGLMQVAQTQDATALVDQVSLLLMGQPLDAKMKRTIVTFIVTKVGATDYLNQVKAAIHLVSTSPQAAAQK